jgi:selenocysteine-specific elongation factor
MTLVVGTAGHIDHGKTTLLRALTGIDADRLPEERRRGMTIDVGYAHLDLDDGTAIDFVDVPGHDRLVGNMLVGAGEIDAVLLVVAADDGPRAQTIEHVALLDALGIAPAVAVVTKVDTVDPDRVRVVVGEVGRLLAPTSMASAPVLAASGVTGEGLVAVREALVALRDRAVLPTRPAALAIDRVFAVKGRGVVVTGTLRGGPLATGDSLRVVPGAGDASDDVVRVREIQVHGSSVAGVAGGGRTALNLAGVGVDRLHRGIVLTADPGVAATDRLLVVFASPVADRARGRVHAGTAAVDGAIGRAGRDALTLPDGRAAGVVRLAEPVALRPGDHLVLRRGAATTPVGAVVLDIAPPRGLSRRRQTAERVAALDTSIDTADADAPAARLDLHGALIDGQRVRLAADVTAAADEAALAMVAGEPGGARLPALRASVVTVLRRLVTIRRDHAATAAVAIVDGLVAAGRLVRDGDGIRLPEAVVAGPDPALSAAMDRLEARLAVPDPPPLGEAARAAGCPPDGIRALERSARIVVLEPDLAYAMTAYRDLAAQALRLARRAPLTPAAFRDATGTSRKYVMAILEDLDRRAILRRTPAGHVPGPKAPSEAAAG